MFSSERNEIRRTMFEAWRKHLKKEVVEPIDAEIIAIALEHPEYHTLLSHPDKYQDADFIEANPFLHLGLHLSLRDQVRTNRPPGISSLYQNLLQKLKDPHLVEHQMIDCLAEILWTAQHTGVAPNETDYLEKLMKL